MKWTIKILLLLLCYTAVYACVRVDDELPNTDKVELTEGKWTQITNLKLEEDLYRYKNSRSREQYCTDRFFFDLDTGEQVPTSDAFTNEWDFGIQFFSDRIFEINHQPPNVSIMECKWVGSQGEPMLCTLVPEDFEKVTEAPDPKEYQYNAFRNEYGELLVEDLKIFWSYQYEEENTLIGYYYPIFGILENGSPEGSGNWVRKLIQDRTFILRTTQGKWAKVQIQGIYKDAPIEATEESDPGYLTFRYYVQEDGSRNLDTR